MKVLIVDDQEAVRTALGLLLELNGLECVTAQGPDQALDLIRSEDVGVVIQDMNFSKDTTSGDEGAQLFADIRALDPDLPVVLITAWTSLETAVKLVKQGAADYIAKPWDDQKLVVTVKNLGALYRARRENLSRSTREARARRELSTTLRSVRAGLPQRAPARGRHAGGKRRALGRAGVDHGPERLRQREAGGDRPGQLAAQRQAVRARERGRAARPVARSRAFRRRSGSLHRRDQAAHRAFRSRSPGHAVPGRDRQSHRRRANAAAPGVADRRVRAPRQLDHAQGRRAGDQRDQRRSEGRDPGRGASARICSSG